MLWILSSAEKEKSIVLFYSHLQGISQAFFANILWKEKVNSFHLGNNHRHSDNHNHKTSGSLAFPEHPPALPALLCEKAMIDKWMDKNLRKTGRHLPFHLVQVQGAMKILIISCLLIDVHYALRRAYNLCPNPQQKHMW